MDDYCMESISESVGKLGRNRYKDASVVQTLLNSYTFNGAIKTFIC
mgnify:CR=1 FL=1